MSLLVCAADSAPLPHSSAQQQQSRPMLPAAAEMQLGAWNAALPALKLSFRDALASTLPDQASALKPQGDLSLQLLVPALVRDTSTASTPTGSITPAESEWQSAASSRCSSPTQLQSQWPDSQSEHLSYSADSEWSELADFSLPPLDLSTDVEVDFEALEREAWEEAEAAEEADFRLAEAASASAVDPFTELLSFRSRHRLIAGCPSLNDRLESTNWANRRTAGRALTFYTPAGKAGSRLAHMQLAARGLDRRGRNIKPTPAAPKEVALCKKGRVPGPYDRLRLQLPAPKPEPEQLEQAQRVQKHHNHKTGAQRVARVKTHSERHSLAAEHRPAMIKAVESFRTVLRERVARKEELKHEAAKPRQLPRHMRPCSVNPHPISRSWAAKLALMPPVATPAAADADAPAVAPLRYMTGFDAFRHSFYVRNRDAIETALTGSHRVINVRLAPLESKPRQRFMSKLASLAPSENKVPLVFHGTRSTNIDSICEKGLLVPNRAGNGIKVAHGSALGVGIYSARSAEYPRSFCGPEPASGVQTMFVCAAITAGVQMSSAGNGHNGHCRISGDVVVLFDEARVAPLFLLDFAPADRAPQPEEPEEPEPEPVMALNQESPPPAIDIQLVRRMLAAAHSKQRKAQAHASKLNKQTVCSLPEMQ